MKKLRILPVTLAAMVLLFGVKLTDVWHGSKGMFISIEHTEALAAEDKKPVEEEAKATPAEDQEQSQADDKKDSASNEGKSESRSSSIVGTQEFSDSEIEILEKLTARRAALDKRGAELDLRDNLLKATETRVDEKIAQLKKIEATIQELLVKHDKQEADQLASLVKIYEKMKPKHAARIFNGLDMDILLNVASMMKESKMAEVLAAMQSDKANKLTVELATRRQLPGEKKTKG